MKPYLKILPLLAFGLTLPIASHADNLEASPQSMSLVMEQELAYTQHQLLVAEAVIVDLQNKIKTLQEIPAAKTPEMPTHPSPTQMMSILPTQHMKAK